MSSQGCQLLSERVALLARAPSNTWRAPAGRCWRGIRQRIYFKKPW